jgi:hypothetical protein
VVRRKDGVLTIEEGRCIRRAKKSNRNEVKE